MIMKSCSLLLILVIPRCALQILTSPTCLLLIFSIPKCLWLVPTIPKRLWLIFTIPRWLLLLLIVLGVAQGLWQQGLSLPLQMAEFGEGGEELLIG